MGWFADLWEGIKETVSDVFEAVKETVSTVFEKVLPALAPVLAVLAPILLPEILVAIEVLAPIVMKVCKAIGWLDKDFDPEEQGKKAILAAEDGIVPEGYESMDEYMAALQNYELDPERAAAIVKKEALLAGFGLAANQIKEKVDPLEGSFTDVVFLVKWFEGTSAERLVDYVSAAGGPARLCQYFKGELTPGEKREVLDSLWQVETRAKVTPYPDRSAFDIAMSQKKSEVNA